MVSTQLTEQLDARQITALIKEVFIRDNLPFNRCSVMMEQPRRQVDVLQWQHKYSKRSREQYTFSAWFLISTLQAAQDTCRSVKIIADVFDVVLELSKMLKYSTSTKKTAMLLKLKLELAPEILGVNPLCPTRWTVRAQSLRYIRCNNNVIQSVYRSDYSGNVDVTSSARGISEAMETLNSCLV